MGQMKRLLEDFEYFEDYVEEPTATHQAPATTRPSADMSREQFHALLNLMAPGRNSDEGSYEFMRAMLGLPSMASPDDALGNVDHSAVVDPDAYVDDRVGSNPGHSLEAK